MEYKRLIPSQFADNAGIPRSSFSQLTKRDKINSDVISKIHQTYPDLSIEWLLWGEGEMLSASTGNENKGQVSNQPELKFDDTESMQEESVFIPTPATEISLDGVDTTIIPDMEPAEHIRKNIQIETAQGKQPPRITKIIVFYDDNTFESFVNDKMVTTPQK